MIEGTTPPEHIRRELDGMYLSVSIGGKREDRCLTDLVWEDVEKWLMTTNERQAGQTEEDRAKYLLAVIKHLHERLRFIGDALRITPVDRTSLLNGRSDHD